MSAAVDVAQPKNPIDTTEDCRFCWMCRQACPVGHVTARETLTPHGWALTIDSVKRGNLTWTAETIDVLYSCADCGLCRAHCITDRPLPEAITAVRAELVAKGQAPAIVEELNQRFLRTIAPSTNVGVGEVGLFVGEVAGAEVDAVIKLLAAVGIAPVLIGQGRSNGVVASSLGLRETAVALARQVLSDIAASACRELLVLTPEDRFGFERVYVDRLGLGWLSSVKVREVTAVLAEALAGGRLSFKPLADAPAYAYHDPCHSARIERDDAAPRALLRAVLGSNAEKNLFWRGRRAHPCGAVGGLQFTQPAIAAKLADARLEDAKSAGASWLITDDPACAHHLRSRPQQDVTVRGFYELLAEQLVG